MKKVVLTFFIICSFLFFGCNTKTSQNEAQNISQTSSQNEQITSVSQPEERLRIREFDWYVGRWKQVIYDDINREKPPITVKFEIKKNGDEYEATLNDNGNIIKGKLYIDKYFLPNNVSDKEKSNYDSQDYLVVDFTKYRYWIGITYGDMHDKISLCLDDIDVFTLIRESTTEVINEFYSVLANEGLNVRKEPSLNSEKVGLLKYKQIVRATKRTTELIEIDGTKSNWFYINYHNLTGWVFGGYLKEVKIPIYELNEINSVIYNDFKTSYGKLKPEFFFDNWIGFYIFAYDEVNKNQKIEMLMNDLDVIIKDKDYEIISGVYKDNENKFGAFIAKVVPTRDKVIDVYEISKVTDETFLKIVFMQKNNGMIYLTNEFRKPFVYKFNPNDLKTIRLL